MTNTQDNQGVEGIATVDMARAAQIIAACYEARQPLFIHGPTGCGKTEVMGQVSKQLTIGLRTSVASLKMPTDLSGIPVPDLQKREAIWLRPTELPQVERDGPTGIFFLDELNAAPQSTMVAYFGLVREGRVADHVLDPNWVVMAAGNRLIDKAAAQRMPTALRNRFLHINVVPTVAAWSAWAAANGVNPFLIAFINFRPGLLFLMPGMTYDNIKIPVDAQAFPTSRAWTSASKFINQPKELRSQLVSGLVSEGPSFELEGFLRVCQHLPTFAEIVANPKTANVPTDPAAKWACSALLAREANRQNFDAVLEYADRLGAEFAALTFHDATKRHPDLVTTGAYASWAVDHQEMSF